MNILLFAGILLWSMMSFGILACAEKNDWNVMNPCYVHKNSKLNWLGAIMISLFYTVLCPVGAIGYWFYKLFTIGKKT